MQVIPRKEIPAVDHVEIEGKKHSLGLHQDFRRNKTINEFLPDVSRLSISWVRLLPKETLAVHEHPTQSMIIICQGEGKSMGEVKKNIQAGDVVIVPPHHKHGFMGTGKEGFWALSIQFEGKGLYEDLNKPRVRFIDQFKHDFEMLEKDQKRFEKRYDHSKLMILMRSGHLQNDEVRERMLEGLNYWSNWFQRILARRVATGGSGIEKYQALAEEHLEEEVGHNKVLSEMRKRKNINLWDPILDGCCSWFYEKMNSGNEHEKIILIHFVMEAASVVFHVEATKVFPNTKYFGLHNELDEDHYQIGVQMLREDPTLDIPKLRHMLHQGWDMFELLTDRIAAYAESGYKKMAI